MLPMSTRRIAYQKILGCLAATWPAMLFFALGVALVSEDLLKELGRLFDLSNRSNGPWEWVAITGFAFAILLTVFFYHLVATLSLRLKWGALPLAFAITYVGSMLMVGMTFFIFKEAAFLVIDIGLFTAIGALHYGIGSRLEKLAAED